MNLKKQLRFHLEKMGITGAELARRSGVPKQSISDWLAGVMPRSIPQVRKVADVFGVSLDELCFGDSGNLNVLNEISAGFSPLDPRHFAAALPGVAARDLFCLMGMDGTLKQFNPRLAEILGWSVDELQNLPLGELMDLDDRIRANKALRYHIEKGQVSFPFEARLICKNGSFRWFRWNGVVSALDQVIITTVRDVTEEYPVKQEVLQLTELADIVDRVVSLYERDPVMPCFEVRPVATPQNLAVHCYPSRVASAISSLFRQCLGEQRNASECLKLQLEMSVKDGKANLQLGVTHPSPEPLTGLRLDVARHWIHSHQGCLKVDPQRHRFEVELPMGMG